MTRSPLTGYVSLGRTGDEPQSSPVRPRLTGYENAPPPRTTHGPRHSPTVGSYEQEMFPGRGPFQLPAQRLKVDHL
eukprot:CAMPEP_0180129632 /NCGR_PEP_ID=MMETSP0986-20121125/7420_1 /TAXON_ID=697907 /ORGANISM="non described non described, Strain CCMP2293" /LENGTH=75 /DNA_ID=CAMNT_0022069315 /DNA_START=65 /DNA_END=292 /DNA_ORIENTATION=+